MAGPRSSTDAVFVPLVGQFDNIGDVVLRRQLAARLAAAGQVHALVGAAPDSFVEALALPPDAVLYRSVPAWYRSALRRSPAGRVSYFFKPGEIRLAVGGLKEHLGALPLLLAVRAGGGGIGCVGVGARGSSRVAAALAAPALRLAQASYWRDERTRATVGFGSVMPDLAFAEGLDVRPGDGPYGAEKQVVASFRGDRPPLSAAEAAALRDLAERSRCELVIAPQVRRDGPAAEALADRLGARYSAWTSQSHREREVELRRLYRDARLVVSNRLHVLVVALTEDAPVALLGADAGDKVGRHLDVLGEPRPPASGSLEDRAFLGEREPRRRALLAARRGIDEAFAAVGTATGLALDAGHRSHV